MSEPLTEAERASLIAARELFATAVEVTKDHRAFTADDLPHGRFMVCQALVRRSAGLAFDVAWPRFLAAERERREKGERTIFDIAPHLDA